MYSFWCTVLGVLQMHGCMTTTATEILTVPSPAREAPYYSFGVNPPLLLTNHLSLHSYGFTISSL